MDYESKDKLLPQPVGKKATAPLSFPDQDEICRRLDEFYKTSNVELNLSPSQMFQGALYAMRVEYRKDNPDWIAQVAHSLREIFYQFDQRNNRGDAFQKYGSIYNEKSRVSETGKYYNLITDIAHHSFNKVSENLLVGGSKQKPLPMSDETFERIVFQFGKILFEVLRRQLDAHKEIDKFLQQKPSNTISVDEIRSLIEINPDASQYFFYRADEQWLSWLWKNGFLDAIKQKSEDPSRYSYQTPELNYLVRMAEKVSEEVVNIMLAVPISENTFNPEVIDQFWRICSSLPAEQLSRIVPKIAEEKWIPLLGSFIRWGFDMEKMFQSLSEAKDYKNILTLARAVLSVKNKSELKQTDYSIDEDPFYFHDLSYTKVYDHLANIPDDLTEDALVLETDIMVQIISLGRKNKDESVFQAHDFSPLYSVDFFNFESSGVNDSNRNDVRALVAVIVNLTKRIFCKSDVKSETIKKYYDNSVGKLPDSQLMWRLKLFVLTLRPEVFKKELKDAFFRIFLTEKHYELIAGTEYEKAIKKGFAVLSDTDQRKYIQKAIVYFGEKQENNNDERDWRKEHGSRIFTMIANYLTSKEKTLIRKAGFEIKQDYLPRTVIGPIVSGTVHAKGPITAEEFNELSLKEIVEKFKDEWSPEKLRDQYKNDDFLNQRNAEGVSDLLKIDIPKRLEEYVNKAELFFDRESMDQHYTYSFLKGVQEALKSNRNAVTGINLENLINLCESILNSNKTKTFETEKRSRDRYHTWLTNWDGVYSAITDVVQELIKEDQNKTIINFGKYRDKLLTIIKLLLVYPDPKPEDEKIETATSTTKSPDDTHAFISDPFMMAINSVRGQAFEAFVMFIFQDGKKFSDKAEIKIDEDLKKLYENTLQNEDTRAIRFLFGYYLPTFYYRNKEWIVKLLPSLFPLTTDKKYFYIATWEGYLANNLYKEIFFNPEFQKLYRQGIETADWDFPMQKHFKDPDEGLATHLALAYIFYENFGLAHPLFLAFWAKNIPEQHADFIEFIGRSFLHGDNDANREFLETNPNSKQKIKNLWEWLFDHYKFENEKPFLAFGSWIDLEKDIFNPDWLANQIEKTLEKTKGALSWDYGLTKVIPELAEKSPKNSFEIIRLFLLENNIRGSKKQFLPHLDDEWFEALKNIYDTKDVDIKSRVYNLINDLIQEGGSPFWKYKEILEEK